ncbi:hypothetical protein EZS27_005466 [termite gut metagenome]|uniref:DUF2851 domain-containing protein n=1 Tax=termite gut metagenome TaxID=433724 RepID=A0A5J4SPN4_9ZZZZ
MEQLLHYVWKHKIFPLRKLQTTSGLPLEIIDQGLHNPNAGPDFFNAKIKINETLWVGNIEIHTLSSDWKRHGHHKDKAYNSVILHVAEQTDCEVFRLNGEEIPQLHLPCPDNVRKHYDELCQTEINPSCYSILHSLPKLTVHSWFTALQSERFEQKTKVIFERLKRHDNNWEDTFFVTLARNFGFGLNGDAFEAWANQLPFRSIDKHRDSLMQVEAFFFGQAGLLDEELPDEYYRQLQKEYRYLQHKFELHRTDIFLWYFAKLRPGNFPHIRIAQLALLYHQKRALFSRIMETQTAKDVKDILSAIHTSDYWESHYNFNRSSPRQIKSLGDATLNLILINTVIPFFYAYGLHKADDRLCDRASVFLETLKAENNHIIRSWANVGLPVYTAADSQALLQLRKEYCDKKKCLHCRFGYEFLRK